MGGLEIFGIGSVGLLLIAGGIGFLVRRYSKAKKREGAAEVQQKATEEVLSEIQKAKKVEEAARRASDPDWDKRVRDYSLRD